MKLVNFIQDYDLTQSVNFPDLKIPLIFFSEQLTINVLSCRPLIVRNCISDHNSVYVESKVKIKKNNILQSDVINSEQ